MKSLRNIISAFLVLTLLSAVSASHASGVEEAGSYVESMGSQALQIISNASLGKPEKQKKLENLFSDSVDIEWVGRFVLGRAWRQATDAQKSKYLASYKRFLIRHYTSRFIDYTGGTFKVTGAHADGEGEYTVNMSLQGDKPNSEEVYVDYRLHTGDKGRFKVFDVVVEGVSLITTQRSEFSSVVSSKGLDYLIAQLEAKSASGELTSTP